jgi:glycosyltransferase involved in cell wall biosynthesis
MSVGVSVILPVLNEAENLRAALASVAWADEVCVVDSGSTDGTCAIARDAGAVVVRFVHHSGGPKKKAWALANLHLRNEWVLLLDADERVTPELRREIEDVLRHGSYDGYYLDREMIFRGRILTCYRPDWNLRLFRRACGSMEDLGLHGLPGTGDNEVHEHIRVAGRTAFLANPLLHDDYRGIGHWIDRHNRYATWEAHLYRRWRTQPLALNWRAFGDPVSRNRLLRRVWVRLPCRPGLRFLIWLIAKRGFRDGYPGVLYSLLMGWYELLVGLKLAELADESQP